jgi:HEAT repeat protein
MGSAARPAGHSPGKTVSSPQGQPVSADDARQLEKLKPQKQAETLLEQAVGHSNGAVEEISSRVDRWQGKVQWSPQIATLTTAALNSNDMRVRESGIEVELAAYGLGKNSASLQYLLKLAAAPDHAQKIWALWALGLMANRGVETEQIVGALTGHLQDGDVESRKWAVEGLALAGTDQAATVLLKTMHDDASPAVRERAACGIAESGMFTPEQRMAAVPQLLSYTDDSSLDAQTHGWAFQALSDITHERFGNDSAAWRSWYEAGR